MNSIKPKYLTKRYKITDNYLKLIDGFKKNNISTICQESRCPNIYECWEVNEATFLIGGSKCTRRCAFCNVSNGKPDEYDVYQPKRIADTVIDMKLRYSTLTGVARDDLVDNGTWLYAETVRLIKRGNIDTLVEILIPDFKFKNTHLDYLIDSGVNVVSHNLETVRRLHKKIRPSFDYNKSLDVLKYLYSKNIIVKSNLILGFGEEIDEVKESILDLHSSGCRLLTITQYLQPSLNNIPVHKWVSLEIFHELDTYAKSLGMISLSGPLVRSSYKAYELYKRYIELKEE